MVKIKNKTYQPIPLIINGETKLLPKRKSKLVEEVTSQMIALKAQGLVQIIKK
jgi:hypothetical protein